MPNPVDDAHVGVESPPRRSSAKSGSVPPRGNRKVLMIASAFPPTGGSGVQRSANPSRLRACFAEFLPQFGWMPTVWTGDEVDGLPHDPTLGDEQPLEAVVSPRNAGSGVPAMRRSLRGFVNARAGEGLAAVASRLTKAVDWRLEAWQSATSLPDDCSSWLRRSVGPLIRRVRSEHIGVIYSTHSPASNHRLALELKRRMSKNLPWVADFRDWWTDDRRYREPTPKRRAALRQWEQEVLETADVVIAVSERQRKILADRMPSQRDKFIVITNGFDPASGAIRTPSASAGSWPVARAPGSDCESEGLEVDIRMELARQLASVFDRLADRVRLRRIETVYESLATCPP